MLAIWGSHGNMGKRYVAIAKYLEISSIQIDLGTSRILKENAIRDCSHHIICVPTNFHLDVLFAITNQLKVEKKINRYLLCEKPVDFFSKKISIANEKCKEVGIKPYVVNQYLYFPEYSAFSKSRGNTYYNYFNSGSDGLMYDCISLLGLATGSTEFRKDSPIWQCEINGISLDISNLNQSYIEMIKDFLGLNEYCKEPKRLWDFEKAIEVTKKLEARL